MSTIAQLMATNPNLGITGAAKKRVSDKMIKIGESMRPENIITNLLGKTIGVRFAKAIGVSPERVRKLAGVPNPKLGGSSPRSTGDRLGEEASPILQKIEKNTEQTNSFLAQMLGFLSMDQKRKDIEENFAKEREQEKRKLSPINDNNRKMGTPTNDNKQQSGWFGSIIKAAMALWAISKVKGLGSTVWQGLKGIIKKIGIATLFRSALGKAIGASLVGAALGGPVGLIIGLVAGLAIDYAIDWLSNENNVKGLKENLEKTWQGLVDAFYYPIEKFNEFTTEIDKAIEEFRNYIINKIIETKNKAIQGILSTKEQYLSGNRFNNQLGSGNPADYGIPGSSPGTGTDTYDDTHPKYDNPNRLDRIPKEGTQPWFKNKKINDGGGNSNIEKISNTKRLSESQLKGYFDKIAQRESSGNQRAINELGYVGKYQFGAGALVDEGYVKEGTTTNQLKNPDVWTGKDGIKNREDFLNSISVQEKAMRSFTEKNLERLKKLGIVTNDSGKEFIAGRLAAAHLLGAKGSKDLRNIDANRTSGQDYYNMFAGNTNDKLTGGDPGFPSEGGYGYDTSTEDKNSGLKGVVGNSLKSIFKFFEDPAKHLGDSTAAKHVGEMIKITEPATPALRKLKENNAFGISDFINQMESIYDNVKESLIESSKAPVVINNNNAGGSGSDKKSTYAKDGMYIGPSTNRGGKYGYDGVQMTQLKNINF